MSQTPEEYIQEVTVGPRQRHDAPVVLVEYDPAWPELYAREEEKIRTALGERALLVEHTGSTAPPALSISGRMVTTLILSAATAAVGVWLVLTSRRAVDEPSRATGPLEAPTAQGQDHASATPEKRATAASTTTSA